MRNDKVSRPTFLNKESSSQVNIPERPIFRKIESSFQANIPKKKT
jgi:hypothetical protein